MTAVFFHNHEVHQTSTSVCVQQTIQRDLCSPGCNCEMCSPDLCSPGCNCEMCSPDLCSPGCNCEMCSPDYSCEKCCLPGRGYEMCACLPGRSYGVYVNQVAVGKCAHKLITRCVFTRLQLWDVYTGPRLNCVHHAISVSCVHKASCWLGAGEVITLVDC